MVTTLCVLARPALCKGSPLCPQRRPWARRGSPRRVHSGLPRGALPPPPTVSLSPTVTGYDPENRKERGSASSKNRLGERGQAWQPEHLDASGSRGKQKRANQTTRNASPAPDSEQAGGQQGKPGRTSDLLLLKRLLTDPWRWPEQALWQTPGGGRSRPSGCRELTAFGVMPAGGLKSAAVGVFTPRGSADAARASLERQLVKRHQRRGPQSC